MGSNFFHVFVDQLAVPGWCSILILSIITELGIAAPIITAFLLLIGQGIRWVLEHRMKKQRHDLAMKLMQEMMNGKMDYNQALLDKLLDDKD